MMADWRQLTVNELQTAGKLLVEDGNHGEYRPRLNEFGPEGLAFIRAADMNGGRILFQSADRINETAFARIRKGIGAPGDVLLSHKGTVGKVAFAPIKCEPFVCSPQTTFWRTLDDNFLDRKYLYFFLQSDNFRQQLNSRKGETDMADYVSLTVQRTLRVLIPLISEQRAIAHILGTLDDKVELNRCMNETLEAMARALFKSWFMDFDPVRAKAEGRQPKGMDAATTALFPDEFEDSQIGPIPGGWKIGRLDDLLVLQRGFDLPTSQRIAGSYPVVAASGPSGTHSEYRVKGPGVVTGRSGLIGKVFFVHEDFWPLNTSLWVKEFRLSTPIYAYHLLQTLDFEAFNAGSAVPTLNRNHVHNLPVVVPPRPIVEIFEGLTKPLFQKCYLNERQNYTLVGIRDALLSKLMSGELRVPEGCQPIGGAESAL